MAAKSAISDIPMWQIKEAAAAWRAHDVRPVGLFRRPIGNSSTHDRIDDLVAEVEYLREKIVAIPK